jgi:protein SCO1/2
MAKLQSDMNGKPGFRLVSISIDPEHDTPEVLTRYAERFHADPKLWLFLTGDRDKIYQLAQQGFHLSAMPLAQQGGQASDGFIHSSRFVLVDGEASIRGYYDSSDAAALSRLKKDLTILLEEHRELYG